MEHLFDDRVEKVKGFATVTFKGWGDPSPERMYRGGKAAPTGKELEEVATRRARAGARGIRVLLQVAVKTFAAEALAWGEEPFIGESRVGIGDVLFTRDMPRVVLGAREELEPRSSPTVHVEGVVLGPSRFE